MIKNTKISIFKSLFKSSDVPYDVSLDQSLKRIREGKSKHIIDKMMTSHRSHIIANRMDQSLGSLRE